MRTYKEVRQALSRLHYAEHSQLEGAFVRDKPFVHTGDTFTDADLIADTTFLDAWTRPIELMQLKKFGKKFKVNPVLQYFYKETIFADPLKGTEWKIDLEPGLYKRAALLRSIRKYLRKKKDLSAFDFTPFLHTDPLVFLSYSRHEKRQARLMGSLDGSLTPILNNSNTLHNTAWHTLPGLTYNEGKAQPGPAITSEQYLKLLPALYTGMARFGFIYTYCVWDESIAPEWDRAPDTLKNFQEMLKLLPQVTCYGAIPCRLRYTGFAKTSQGGVIRRIEEPYSTSDNSLLYDGPAWILLLAIDGEPVRGRIAVTEDGRFIVSDWCFRETPHQDERYEMFSGAFIKHTLLTWCAGPLLDRFGGSTTDHVSPGSVDGRAYDADGKNRYRMRSISSGSKMQTIVKKLITSIVKNVEPLTLEECKVLASKGFPIAGYLPQETYVVYCTSPVYHCEKLYGFKASHMYCLTNDKQYRYSESSAYITYLMSSPFIPLPLGLVEELFNITHVAPCVEIPLGEPTFVTPMAPPVFIPGGPDVPYLVPSQEPEPVPPVPQEAP